MKVYSAISAVAKAMSHDGISKARKNTTQGYNFRGIDDVLNALSSALTDAGLLILPRVTERTEVERQTKNGGALFYVTVHVDFDLVAVEDGSKHTVTTYGEAMDSADKATNKAMSAAYKYLALLTFCIPTEATPDTDADFTTHEVKGRDAVREQQRARWLADQQAAIDAAATVGEMKEILGRAILTAQAEGDDEAVGILQAAAATKIAKAKKTTTKESA